MGVDDEKGGVPNGDQASKLDADGEGRSWTFRLGSEVLMY